MNWTPTPPDDGVSRRSFLAAGATGAAITTSGCIDRVRSVVDQNTDEQLSLSIATVPADSDRQNIRIARRLEANLKKVGIDVSLDMRSQSELLKSVLLDHDFDIYVGLHPASYDPDFLYEALYSRYADESGWQNPFGYSAIYFDTLLENQRHADGDERKRHVQSLLTGLAQEKPFEPICFPDEVRVASTDRFDGWADRQDLFASRHGYLGLEPADDTDQLHALVTDGRLTRNLNPLSATFRERDTIIDLLYDSLLTEHDGSLHPWLAESVDLVDASADTDENDAEDDPSVTATVTLREDCQFHDGEPVTAEDVAFTYRFITDTSWNLAQMPSPAPRYRSQAEMIDGITVGDDGYRLTMTIAGGRAAAKRALTVPILPKHVWSDRVNQYAGSQTFTPTQGQWSAVTASNIPPVGSGPFEFDSRSEDEYLTLQRFDEHFTLREDVTLADPIAELSEPTVAELRFEVDPSSPSAIGRIADGNADLTASMLDAYSLGAIPDSSSVERLETQSQMFYHIGFNVRNEPFSNPHFRRAITQLLDKKRITEDVFNGNATPVATPLTGEWVPDALEWDGEDPVTPFAGSNGVLNTEVAKLAFERAGFRHDDNGRLLGGD
ncbi:ABC transporter substrate-binding protein [Natrinema versiforme]|uniref:Extracellular solute-binding protein family 5 n=1 Tax=Natrinema versiforme JCM 10478 TaxID=1227496 RepID=L9Y8B5_9EURY|nr:ABC transporter substrate-binding protein [Natrinema versiforme]ELY69932.1 extracellular solute-binding protein family 5 [Natrinema versiforme JCM 10478]